MGVCYHAHSRFPGGGGNETTVPAPSDASTPHAPWWYDWIAANALSLRQAGFTAILYPPVCKTSSGCGPTADGYGVFDQYDIGSKLQFGSVETRFGSRERLQRSVAIAHACGLDVYLDVVMHQLSGGDDGVYRYVGANGGAAQGRFPKNPGCFRGAPPRRPEDPVPDVGSDFPFGDELVYVNCDPPGYTENGMTAFGDWLTRSLDIQGYRIDDTKGMAVSFVHHWMTSDAMASRFAVSEYFDGNPANLYYWVHDSGMAGRSTVFDFTLHFALQAMCDDPNFDMTRMEGAGYAAMDPLNAVTFVDNPDTDLSPGEAIMGNKLLAYAFILTTEGYPFVFHKDYATEAGCYGLKPWIDTLVWIHEHLANGSTATRWNDGKTIVLERLGAPGLLTAISTDVWNRRTIQCQTAFGAGVRLHDYSGHHPDVWTDENGRVTFTVPSNAFGSGQSYVCFSRFGLDAVNAVSERPTTQTFFGALDLDVPPSVPEGSVSAGRVWAARGKVIEAAVRPTLAVPHGVSLSLRVVPPAGVGAPSAPPSNVSSSPSVRLMPTTTGWHTLEVTSTGAQAPIPYTLAVTYTAPDTLEP